jgi:hypothetical protein
MTILPTPRATPLASPTAGPRRSLLLTGGTHHHLLPPDSSNSLFRSKKGRGGSRVMQLAWERFSLSPRPPCTPSHPAGPARQPHTRHPAHAQRVHVTSPWQRGSTHRMPTTLTPPTVCRIRFRQHPIRITPLLLALAPAEVASRPFMPSDCHRTVHLAMGEHGV